MQTRTDNHGLWSGLPAAVVAAAAWVVLTGGTAGSWLVGVPTAAAVGWSWSMLRGRPRRRSWLAVAKLIGVFVWESTKAGVDVSRRALSPSMPLEPGVITYRTSLPAGEPRLVFGAAISLVPGTLLVNLHEARLMVHVLDIQADNQAALARLEQGVAAVYAAEEGDAE